MISVSSLFSIVNVLPRFLKLFTTVKGSPLSLMAGFGWFSLSVGGLCRISILEILILIPMSPSAVANFSRISCISAALCETEAVSSAKAVP